LKLQERLDAIGRVRAGDPREDPLG
jgi:hypothetical protein